jgi:hypothetical protein
MNTPRGSRICLAASVLLGVLSVSLLACSGDDDDDTFGLPIPDATTSDAVASDAAGDGASATDATSDAPSVSCVGAGGTCSLSALACAAMDGGALVGITSTNQSCAASGFGTGSVCCTTSCGQPPPTACPAGGLTFGPPYCQNGQFVCPDGTVLDAGTKPVDAGATDSGTDGSSSILDAANEGG